MRYHPLNSSKSSNQLLQTILRAAAIGVIIGNAFFLLYYLTGLPPLIRPSSFEENGLVIVENALHTMPDLNKRSLSISAEQQQRNDVSRQPQHTVTFANRFIRRPPSKNCSLPPGYPHSPPGWKRLLRICGNLDRFSINCRENQSCIDCIPPWGGADYLVKWTESFIRREYETRSKRRLELQRIVDEQLQLTHDESAIVLMTLNSGYGYLFLNWLCGLHALGIAEDIRLTTIVIATDEKTEQLAKGAGFAVVRGDWLDVKIEQAAAEQFALGAHRWTVSLQIVYAFDLIHMGYNIIQQDVDVVWLRDARKYFENTYNDIEMACDGRLDYVGPGNTGFIHVRSNCKTRVYMETLIYYIGLVIAGRSDQRVWNMFLTSYDFRQMLFELLPPDKFVGGDMWGNGKKKGDRLSDHVWFLHSSWTTDHGAKITKFKQIDAWFLNASCSFYADGIVPEHVEPPYYTPPQERTYTWPEPETAKKWWKTKGQTHFYEKDGVW